jgi:hypothetical protein
MQNTSNAASILYHYTTLDGFLGILDTGKMWATHIGYLNDTSEQNLVSKLISQKVNERLENPNCVNRDELIEIRDFLATPQNNDIFVISFSKDGGDRLSQWRGYSGSAGVSIGFTAKELARRCNALTTEKNRKPEIGLGAMLREVKYIQSIGEKTSNDEIDNLIRLRIAVSGMESPLTPVEIFNRQLSFTAFDLKDAAFNEELETRIVIFDFPGQSSLKFRIRKSLLIPYVEFDLGKEMWPLISKIYVGPSPHQRETVSAVKRRIADSRIEVVESAIPYRDW